MYPYDYRELIERMAGVDTDPAVMTNANLSDAAVADLVELLYADGEFDLISRSTSSNISSDPWP